MSTGQSPQRRPGNGADIPVGGAVDLSRVARPPQVTTHVTTFRGCQIEFYAVKDAENKIEEYMCRIFDPYNKHTYILNLGPDRDGLCAMIMSLPAVGTVAE